MKINSVWWEMLRSVFFGVVGAAIVVVGFYKYTAEPQIVTVDLQQIIDSKKQEYLGSTTGTTGVKEKTERFANALNIVVEETAEKFNYILIPKAAVFAGNVPDVTEYVANEINSYLQESQKVSLYEEFIKEQ